MAIERLDRISEILEKTLARQGSAREAYAREACEENPGFREELDSLLASHIRLGAGFSAHRTPSLKRPQV
jgi:hypothetical protein